MRTATVDADSRRRALLRVLDRITRGLTHAIDRKDEGHRVLRKGLAYCWSVAVAAYPIAGKRAMEKWLRSDDADVRWVMRKNLGKARLVRMDPEWVGQSLRSLDARA